MSDGTLSQDEIDALLQGTGNVETPPAGGGGFNDSITDQDISNLNKVLSEIIDSQTSTLGGLFQKDVSITNPKIDIINSDTFSNIVPLPVLEISFPFVEGISGDNIYLFEEKDALSIGSMMMAQDVSELTDMIISAVAEAVSQMVGSALTTISNKYKLQITTGSPQQIVVKNYVDAILPSEDNFVLITYNLKIDTLSTVLYHIMSTSVAKGLASLLVAGTVEKNVSRPSEPSLSFSQPSTPSPAEKAYQPASFSKIESVLTEEERKNISLLLDVEMEVTVELGRTKKTIKDILSMGEGTIISLDRLAGESIDILVNGKKIAKGEVIVIDENFGVRITEILSKSERLNSLK